MHAISNDISRDATLAVLCGGRATRWSGRAKGLVEIGGRPILERLLENLSPLFSRAVLLGGREEDYGRFGPPILKDAVADIGPMGGLLAALEFMETPALFLTACDMPFVRPELVRLMLDSDPAADLAVVRIAGRPEPTLQRVSRNCIPAVHTCIREGRYKLTAPFGLVRTHYLDEAAVRAADPDLRSLVNLNRPEDLEKLAKRGF